MNSMNIDGKSCVHVHDIEWNSDVAIHSFLAAYLTIDKHGHLQHCCAPCSNTSSCSSYERQNMNMNCYEDSSQQIIKTTHSVCNSNTSCNAGMQHFSNSVDIQTRTTLVSFQLICDGFVHYLPALFIDGINETDETHCEQWPCSNIYTRCDRSWTCLNGADELDCPFTVFFPCPSKHHPCVSPTNLSAFCPPMAHFNDGIIDCLGAMDERGYCRQKAIAGLATFRYRCWNSSRCVQLPSCVTYKYSCDFANMNLKNKCSSSPNLFSVISDLDYDDELEYRPNIEVFFLRNSDLFPPFLSTRRRNTNHLKASHTETKNIYDISYSEVWICNRGILIRVGPEKSIRCLCPPSYYGTRCQYQAQRVSLSLQFQRICSPVCQGLFTLVASLFDTQTETVHSREIVSYMAQRDCYRKFNIYLLYRDRPKNPLLSYNVRIDAYEKSGMTLTYYTSYLLQVKLSFLPVNRVAAFLTLSKMNPKVRTCTRFCGHGQCMLYANTELSSYCLCEKGWSGMNCTISHKCDCSPDALCVGSVSNSNKSTCLCPLHKFGPRCTLPSICEIKPPCKHSATCVPDNIDPYTYICVCPNGYSGAQCDNMEIRIIISFQDIDIPQTLLAHFVTVRNRENPASVTLPTKIRFDQNEAVLYFSQEFHIGLVQILANYYLIFLQEKYEVSVLIRTVVSSSRRCPSVRELMKTT